MGAQLGPTSKFLPHGPIVGLSGPAYGFIKGQSDHVTAHVFSPFTSLPDLFNYLEESYVIITDSNNGQNYRNETKCNKSEEAFKAAEPCDEAIKLSFTGLQMCQMRNPFKIRETFCLPSELFTHIVVTLKAEQSVTSKAYIITPFILIVMQERWKKRHVPSP